MLFALMYNRVYFIISIKQQMALFNKACFSAFNVENHVLVHVNLGKIKTNLSVIYTYVELNNEITAHR